MLTARFQGIGSGGLGQGDLTPEEEAQLPHYVGIGQQLKNSEDSLLAAYTNVATLVGAIGDQTLIPSQLLVEYNNNVYQLDRASEDWMDAQRAVGQPADPVLPPRFADGSGNVLTGASLSGLGAEVPARQINVVYGRKGQERVMPLGDPRASSLGAKNDQDDLGVAWLAPLFILLAVAVVVAAVAWLARSWQAADVEASRARAREAEAHAEQVKLATETLLRLYSDCAAGSTDPKQKLACMQAAVKGTKGIIKALPKTKGPGDQGRGFLGTVGLIVVLLGLGYGGWKLYQVKKERDAEGRAGRLAPADDLEPL